MKNYFRSADFAEPEEEPAPRILWIYCPDPQCKGNLLPVTRDEGEFYIGQCSSCGRRYLFSPRPDGSFVLYAPPRGYCPAKDNLLPPAHMIYRMADGMYKDNEEFQLKRGARNQLKMGSLRW